MSGWIGVDLDGTLARYDGWKGDQDIGEPIPAMVARVRAWLREGREVRIFTARAWKPQEISNGFHVEPMTKRGAVKVIEEWCLRHIGVVLPVTCTKDYGMVTLYDDRCVQVEMNTGRLINAKEE